MTAFPNNGKAHFPRRAVATLAGAIVLIVAMPARIHPQDNASREGDTPPTADAAKPGPNAMPEGLDAQAALLARLSGIFGLEDPTSVYDFDIDDNEVEFVLDGTWEARLDGFLDFTVGKDATTMSFTPPVFSQAVNLSSWVLINQTWYFEASFQEEFRKNTVAAGYLGGEEDPVKHVRVGNSKIVFPDAYEFISVGGGTAIAPGVMGTFAGDDWNADAIVRYDAAAARELILSGMNEVSDEFVPITGFARGKWFVLPEAPVSGAVTVFVTDDEGAYRDDSSRVTGRRWRKLAQEEYTVRGPDGLLELKTETSGSVAVAYYGSYASSPSTAGASLLSFVGETKAYFDAMPGVMPSGFLPDPADSGFPAAVADRFLVDIAGTTALIVRERGHFSPFENLSRYRAESPEPELVYEGSLKSPPNLAADQYDESYAEVFRADGYASTGTRDPVNRFPLAREFPLLYLPSGGGQKADTDLALLNRNRKPISTISLGENAIAGTIQVTRNGIVDDAFEFDDETGILTLARNPSMTETVRITWLDTDDAARNATLTVAGGARWKPNDSVSLFSASSFKWNVSKTGYSDADQQSPGSFIVSVGGEYAGARTKASTAFALDVSVPDTTGLYRVEGMDSGTNAFYPDDGWYETIGADTVVTIGKPASTTSIALDPARYMPPAGSSDDAPPTVTDPSMSGSVLVLSARLTARGQWTGASILAGEKGDLDLSAASTVSVWIRNPGQADSFETYLQLGSGNAENGDDPDTVRTWRIQTPAAGSGWVKRTVTLDDSDRAALVSGGNLRVIARPNQTAPISESSPLSISLRTGALSYTDTGFSSKVEPPFSDSTGRLSVDDTVDPAPVTLVSSGADEPRRFNAGSTNAVLVARYTPEDGTERAILSSHLRPMPLSSYDELSFFVYVDALPPESAGSLVRLTLSRPASSGSARKTALEAEIAASAIRAGVWQKVTVDFGSRRVSVGDTERPDSRARVVSLDVDEAPTRVELSLESWPAPATPPPSGATAYTIAFDEIFLGGTEAVYTYRNRSAYSWKREGAILSVGEAAIISDPSFGVTADSSVRKNSSEARASGTAAGGIGIFRARADGTITASSETARVADSTSHAVSVPIWPITVRENYAADFTGNDFSRKDSVSLSGPLALDANASVDLNGRNLARSAAFSASPRFPVTPIGAFTLRGDSGFSQTGLSPVTDLSRVEWQDLWMDTLAYSVSTGESDATRRKGKHSVEAGWRTEGGSGVTVSGEAASSYAAASETTIGSEISFAVNAPVRIGLSTLTPSWKRTAGESRSEDKGGSYFSDADFLSASGSRLSYLFSVAPFGDLVEDDIADRISDTEGTYARSLENRYGISWTRPSVGRVSDLWVPSMVDASLSRQTRTDATVSNISDEWNASARAGMSALNMAGAFGVRRIFKWYEQDEISQLYSWNGKWGKTWFTWNVDTLHSLTLLFPEKASFVADNAFHYDSPDIAGDGELVRDTVRFVWKRPGKDSFVAAIAAQWTKLPLTTAREETVSVSVTRGDTDSESASFDHVLKTGIGANGEISVNTGFSYASGEDITTIGFRLGVGGKLTY
jgi:DNA polymerase-4